MKLRESTANRLEPKRKLKKTQIQLLLMVLPCMAFLFAFYYAQLFGWAYAFVDYKPSKKIWEMSFEGLRYFKKMIDVHNGFAAAMRNTLVYGISGLLLTPLPAVFAICLSEVRNPKLKKLIQTTSSFPYFISWTLVYAVCFIMFNSQGQISELLVKWGLMDRAVNLLASEDAAYALQIFLGVWKGLGWSAILYMAAIAGVDQELHEAAAVDGANRFQRIWHITVPGLLPTFFVLFIMAVANLFNTGFEQYYMFYNSMVADKLDVIATYVYRRGLGNGEYSYATAVGMAQSLVSIVLLYITSKVSKKVTGNSII